MKRVSVADMQGQFSVFLNESQNQPVLVMDNGKPIAVLLAVHDQDELDRLIFASSHRLQEILAAGRKEIHEGRGIPRDEFWKQVEAEQGRKTRSRGKNKNKVK